MQVVVPCLDHISFELNILDKNGKTVSAYDANQTEGKTGVWIRVGVTDPFGLNDLESVAASVTDSKGVMIIDSQIMSLESLGASFYSGTYVFNSTFPVGTYSALPRIRDMSGNTYYISRLFSISYFYELHFNLADEDAKPLSEANYTISSDQIVYTQGRTNASGWAVQRLPSSDVVGTYAITVLWKNAKLTAFSGLNISGPMTLHFKINVFEVTARCVLYGVPLSGASIQLLANSTEVANAVTELDGSGTFHQIPPGQYVLRVKYMSYQYETTILVEKSYEILVALEIPYLGRIPYAIMALAAISAVVVFVKRKRKLYSAPISILDSLVEGGLPSSATIMILGPSASGKTVLLQNLMNESLEKGRHCVFIATMQFPSEIRKEMKAIGFDISKAEKAESLAFIDCYSAAAGQASIEKYSVSSITDLTRLGTQLSTCLENFGKETDVFLDSLAPWIAALRPEFIVSFLHATGAKVKAGNGKFYFTVGTSVDTEFLTKIEEASDGVMELAISESEKEPRRKLAIRKVRGRKHSRRWLDFSIIEGKGIVFRVRGKTMADHRKGG